MTNMLSFQHAYAAAGRLVTAIDETLDVLINRTGLVGR
jgi:flagellar hook-associated protein 1 FlgK